MRTYTELPCNKFNSRFILAPEFNKYRGELLELCAKSDSSKDLLHRLMEWRNVKRITNNLRIDIGLIYSSIGNYQTIILTEIKIVKEGF